MIPAPISVPHKSCTVLIMILIMMLVMMAVMPHPSFSASSFLATISDGGTTTTTTIQYPNCSLPELIYSALLAFKDGITSDPTGSMDAWVIPNNNTSSHGTSPNYYALHYCHWPGIECNQTACRNGSLDSYAFVDVVTSLALDSLGLQGTLATSSILSLSPYLTFLNISNNSFHGRIFDALDLSPSGSYLLCSTGLTHLDLSHNLFTGSITTASPDQCSTSPLPLRHLDLSYNSFSSPFPAFLTNFSNLTFLDLSGNNITTPLPRSLGHLCSNLQFLHLHDAKLSGSITSSTIANCSSLRTLDLSFNLLSGPLPLDWAPLMSTLEVLNLQSNSFTGSIPISLGNSSSVLTYLDVSQNQLVGPIPSSLGSLASLEILRIFTNRLDGPIPASIVNCTRLIYLKAAYNNLSGLIPDGIGSFRNAIWLSFMGNQKLSGNIPDSIGSCSSLQHLSFGSTSVGGLMPAALFNLSTLLELQLDSAKFSGTLPEQIRLLMSLIDLRLGFNTLQGPIPVGLGQLKELQGIHLQGNRFQGQIPAELSGCSALSIMDLSYNQLSGNIPESFSQLVWISQLLLQHNFLSGEIPDLFGELSRLAILNLSRNMFVGSIPGSLANLITITQTLDLSFNNLSGPIPSSLGGMQMLLELNIAGNKFTGPIPEALGDCLGLHTMNLSANMLDGEIPPDFVNLLSLSYLDLSKNNLSGSLPSYLQSLTKLIFVNLSYNDFQGVIPDIELYKNSSASSLIGNPGLCGYPLLDTPCPTNASSQSRHSRKQTITIAVSLCVVIGMVLAGIVLVATMRHCRYPGSSQAPAMNQHRFREWTAPEIRAMTNAFDSANIIGTGGSSTCYRAILQEELMPGSNCSLVVVKRLAMKGPHKKAEKRMFFNELKVMCAMKHRNLVKVLGYCNKVNEPALIMEYMEEGDLDERLHCRSGNGVKGLKGVLSWKERMKVALDVAEGLVYMHHECVQPIIHCDIKPKNILLGNDVVAKIADFGIAKLLDHDGNGGTSITNMRGSFGYVAPENAWGSRITTKVDVYSYGVVLLEMATGMRPTSQHLDVVGMSNIHTWARTSLHKGEVLSIVDASVREAAEIDRHTWNEVGRVIELGVICTSQKPNDRPTMKDVREALSLMFRSNLSTQPFV